MKLTREQCEDMKDGTILRVVRTGEEWDDIKEDDWLKSEKVIKFGNHLYILNGFFLVEDIDDKDGYDIETFYSKKDNIPSNLPQRLF